MDPRLTFLGLLAAAALSLTACAPPASTASAAAPTMNPEALPQPKLAVEQALLARYAGNPARPVSDYQQAGAIDEGSTWLVLFTYRVADRVAHTSNGDGSPHWEAVVGSGLARVDRRGGVIALTVTEDGEERRAQSGVAVLSLLPDSPTGNATVAGIAWREQGALELRAAKTIALARQGRSPAVFAWIGPRQMVDCGYQIAVGGSVQVSRDRSSHDDGMGGQELRPECAGVAPFYHSAARP